MRKFVARIKFPCNLTGDRPNSLTGHTAAPWRALVERFLKLVKGFILLNGKV